MKTEEFDILIAGLKDKVYQFEYEVDEMFFDSVTEPLVKDPDIQIHLSFDKTHEPYVLDFTITGDYLGECDRCASTTRIPVHGEYRLFVEFGQPEGNDNNTEVIYISRDDHAISLYDHVYDFVVLSIPMVKRCSAPEDKKRCDEKINAYLKDAPVVETNDDPRWEALKKLKK